MEKIDGKSLDIREDSIEKLKQLFPEIITEGEQINFEKLKAILTDDLDESNEKYTFTWNGKSEAMRIANTPTSGTLKPVLDKSKKWESTENIYIEGDNLEVLKLLQKSYSNKVDTIYIDPPYNTGKDFVYNDKFTDSLDNYFKQTGQVDEEGYKLTTNVDSNGRFHSEWLNMMYPRLKIARNLLSEKGIIFINIDDNELANLKKICDEILGESNFIFQIAWRRSDNQPNIGNVAKVKDYILVYAKDKNNITMGRVPLSEKAIKEYRYEDQKGKFRRGILLDRTRGRHYYDVETINGNILNGPWMVTEDKFKELEVEELIYWTESGQEQPYSKIYLSESKGAIPNDFWGIEYGTNQRGSLEVEKLLGKRYFDFPKPVTLLKSLIGISNEEKDSIILDFFSGSGTTAHATMELNAEDGGNRQYIIVQLPEPLEENSVAYKDGYRIIPDIAIDRINQAGNEIIEKNFELEDKLDVGFKYFKLDKSNIKKWNIDEDNLEEELLLFTDNFEEGSTHDDIVYELLLKQGIELTVPIEKKTSEETSIYIIANGAMFVVIGNNIDESIGEYIRDYESMFNQDEDSEIVVAFQDIGFEDDSAKLNTFEILKAAGFKDENIFTI